MSSFNRDALYKLDKPPDELHEFYLEYNCVLPTEIDNEPDGTIMCWIKDGDGFDCPVYTAPVPIETWRIGEMVKNFEEEQQ